MDKSILINIEQTLLPEGTRTLKILKSVFHWDADSNAIETADGLHNVLSRIAEQQNMSLRDVENKFWQSQQSCDYYDQESLKIPQAAKSAFKEMNKHAELIYCSSRAIDAKEEIKKILQQIGLPLEDGKYEIVCIPVQNPETATYEQKSFEEMHKYINNTQFTKQIELVIGGSASDVAAAYSCGVPTVIYGKPDEKIIIEHTCKLMQMDADCFDIYGIACLNNWYDICVYVKSLLGENCGLDEICNAHSTNYADWLSDLDQKSSLILVVGTFCAAVFVDILLQRETHGVNFVSICSLIGFLSSVFSMILAIRSFGSRVTHGSEAIKHVLNINPFQRRRDSFTYSPVAEKKKISGTQFGRTAKLRYLIKRYGTLDHDSISSKNLFNLRAANYEKIYPEFIAKVLLYCSILMIVLIGAFSFLTSLNIFSENKDQLGNLSSIDAYSIDSQTDKGLVKKSVYLFTYDDFSIDFSSLSNEGIEKANQIVQSLPETTSTIYISFDESEKVLSQNKYVANSKREIILLLIHDEISTKNREIEVVFLCE